MTGKSFAGAHDYPHSKFGIRNTLLEHAEKNDDSTSETTDPRKL